MQIKANGKLLTELLVYRAISYFDLALVVCAHTVFLLREGL